MRCVCDHNVVSTKETSITLSVEELCAGEDEVKTSPIYMVQFLEKDLNLWQILGHRGR